MNSACRRSLWGGYTTPRVLLGEYYARHGICPPSATKSTRSVFQLNNAIPSEDQPAERNASKEATKRRRSDRGGGRSGWNSQPSGGRRAPWNSWAAFDGDQSAAASSGGASASAASSPSADAAGTAVGAEPPAAAKVVEQPPAAAAEAVSEPAVVPAAASQAPVQATAAAAAQEGASPLDASASVAPGPSAASSSGGADPDSEQRQIADYMRAVARVRAGGQDALSAHAARQLSVVASQFVRNPFDPPWAPSLGRVRRRLGLEARRTFRPRAGWGGILARRSESLAIAAGLGRRVARPRGQWRV